MGATHVRNCPFSLPQTAASVGVWPSESERASGAEEKNNNEQAETPLDHILSRLCHALRQQSASAKSSPAAMGTKWLASVLLFFLVIDVCAPRRDQYSSRSEQGTSVSESSRGFVGHCPGFADDGHSSHDDHERDDGRRLARGIVYFAAGTVNVQKSFKSLASLRALLSPVSEAKPPGHEAPAHVHATLFTDGAGLDNIERHGWASPSAGLFNCVVRVTNATLSVRPTFRRDEGCRFSNCERSEILALRYGKQQAILNGAERMYETLLFVDADTIFCRHDSLARLFSSIEGGVDVAFTRARQSHEERVLVRVYGARAAAAPEVNTGVLVLRSTSGTWDDK